MRQTPVNDYLEEVSTRLPEELYGNLSDAVYETVCDFDEEVAQLKTENAKLRSICAEVAGILFNLEVDRCGLCDRDSINHPCPAHTTKCGECLIKSELRELGVGVDA